MSFPSSLVQSVEKLIVGNDAAWHLSFHMEDAKGAVVEKPMIEFGRSDYFAEIQATLPSGLEGGVYRFVVEGLSDEVYGKIAQGKKASPSVARLYLYWRDTNASAGGYLKNLAGLTDTLGAVKGEDLKQYLIAELRIGAVTRKAGARRYETTITAKERVFAILEFNRLCAPLDPKEPVTAAEGLAQGNGIATVTAPLRPTAKTEEKKSDESGDRTPELGKTLLEILRDLGKAMEERSNQRGRGMYLIREGRLLIGPRTIDDEIETATELDQSGGLIESEKLEPLVIDENFNFCKARMGDPKAKAPTRDQFKLTMKGRPDMKPGHVVKFHPAPEDEPDTEQKFGLIEGMIGAFKPANLVPALGEDFKGATKLYINSVEHRLGRTSGWVTTVTGVVVQDGEEAWDRHSDPPMLDGRKEKGKETAGAAASAELRAAQAISKRAAALLNQQRHPEVGEVRAMATREQGDLPGQTLNIWTGLERPDGLTHQGRRRPIRRPNPAPVRGVAYLTPFAWGKTGLVLPHYPGTRVLVGYRNGQGDDPMALGALWESGHGPESEPGDWWLILPVGVKTKELEESDETAPVEHTGKVTHDLIDGEGRRAIEVEQLTIRVGSLQETGSRPAHDKNDSSTSNPEGVTIEYAGAKVMIKKGGSIVLHAAKNIELNAPNGDISLNANNVNVKVKTRMNVE